MATAKASLSEDQFICSICTDVFSQPVTIPCGHSFCIACIRKYWDVNGFYNCPVCKTSFETKPVVCMNTLMTELATHFVVTAKVKPAGRSVGMSCDLCGNAKVKAVKSCLVCLASFCDTHLEPHLRAAALKRHKLIDPVDNLEDRLCKKHNKELELFCRKEQMCICVLCSQTDHKGHDIVIIEKEFEDKQLQLASEKANVVQQMQKRQEKIQNIKDSVGKAVSAAGTEVEEAVTTLELLLASIKADLNHQMECLTKELEQEVSALQRSNAKMKKLSLTDDHVGFLQNRASVGAPPQLRDWSNVSVHVDLSLQTVNNTRAQLKESLDMITAKLSEMNKTNKQQFSIWSYLRMGSK